MSSKTSSNVITDYQRSLLEEKLAVRVLGLGTVGLNPQGVTPEVISQRVVKGAMALTANFTGWWKRIKAGEINVRNSAKGPFNLVVDRFNLALTEAMWPSVKESEEKGFIPSDLQDLQESEVLNILWNTVVETLTEDTYTQYATVV